MEKIIKKYKDAIEGCQMVIENNQNILENQIEDDIDKKAIRATVVLIKIYRNRLDCYQEILSDLKSLE